MGSDNIDIEKRLNEICTPENFLKELRPDQEEKTPEKKTEKRGRKNRGQTLKSYEEYKQTRKENYHFFMDTKSPDNFKPEILERVQGEVINDNDINQFEELYKITIDSILDQFKQDNPELIKKHPYQWYKPLLLQIKKNVPRITAYDIDKCFVVWDLLSDLLYNIGLYPTFELFQYMTNIYRYQLENKQGLSPKYAELIKKINNDSDGALINELATSPYNSTNKIFLAKVHGIVEKSEPKQIEVVHSIRNYDSLPMYNGEN